MIEKEGHTVPEEGDEPNFPRHNKTNQPPGTRLSRLERLNCWPDVRAMLLNGEPTIQIVRYIQNERNEYTDVKPECLRVVLYNWMSRNIKKTRTNRIDPRYLAMLEAIEPVEPMKAMNLLFAIQMDRVMIGYTCEKETEKLDTKMNETIRVGSEILKSMGTLRADNFKYKVAAANLSSGKDAKETLDQVEKIQKLYEEKFGAVPAAVAMAPDSRRKVHNALSKVRKGDTAAVLTLLKRNEEKAKEIGEDAINE